MTPPHAPELLIIDDDPIIRAALRRALGRDFQVVEAADAHAARGALEQHDPAAVIADVGLPDADGFELALELRRRRPGLRTIIISGDGLEPEREQQVDWFVSKPFEPAILRKGVLYLTAAAGRRAPITPSG
ncbi:MAG: response regulator [Myxococcales bacterium]|jgi:DNA-binding response OmpR family regulator